MRQSVRGIIAGIGATWLLGSAALAGTGARDAFILRFDLLSPPTLNCNADAPEAEVRSSRDLFGKPMLRVFGNARNAIITCTDRDGSRWQTTASRRARYSPAAPTYGTVLYRPGQRATAILVETGEHAVIQLKSFVRVD